MVSNGSFRSVQFNTDSIVGSREILVIHSSVGRDTVVAPSTGWSIIVDRPIFLNPALGQRKLTVP